MIWKEFFKPTVLKVIIASFLTFILSFFIFKLIGVNNMSNQMYYGSIPIPFGFEFPMMFLMQLIIPIIISYSIVSIAIHMIRK